MRSVINLPAKTLSKKVLREDKMYQKHSPAERTAMVLRTIGSAGAVCEHSDSSCSMSEPAKQASLRKELSNRRRSKLHRRDVSAKPWRYALPGVLLKNRVIFHSKVLTLKSRDSKIVQKIPVIYYWYFTPVSQTGSISGFVSDAF